MMQFFESEIADVTDVCGLHYKLPLLVRHFSKFEIAGFKAISWDGTSSLPLDAMMYVLADKPCRKSWVLFTQTPIY